jgi:VIT1/CCC1 family predicted Fe2+/Mn2+ transporter
MATSSASGVSSIVSNELIDGERERNEVGVLGTLEAELNEYPGYGSLAYLCAALDGEGEVLPEIFGLTALAPNAGALALWCRGGAIRRRDLGKVLEKENIGEWCDRSSSESSSSSFSGILGSMFKPPRNDRPG